MLSDCMPGVTYPVQPGAPLWKIPIYILRVVLLEASVVAGGCIQQEVGKLFLPFLSLLPVSCS